MFRSSTIIREIAMNLAKVIFTLKHSVKLRRYLLCSCVAASHGMAGVSHAKHTQRRNFTKCFNINITLAKFSASSLMMVEDRNM